MTKLEKFVLSVGIIIGLMFLNDYGRISYDTQVIGTLLALIMQRLD